MTINRVDRVKHQRIVDLDYDQLTVLTYQKQLALVHQPKVYLQ